MVSQGSRLYKAGLTNWDSPEIYERPKEGKAQGFCVSEECSVNGRRVYRTTDHGQSYCQVCGDALVWMKRRVIRR